MRLFSSHRAPNPRRVRWVMAEKGIEDVEIVQVDIMVGDHKTPEYRARVGVPHVPALELDDEELSLITKRLGRERASAGRDSDSASTSLSATAASITGAPSKGPRRTAVALPVGAVALFFDTVKGLITQSRYVYSESPFMIGLFVVGLGSLLFAFAITNTLFNASLMRHLAPHQQAKYQTPVQTLAAVGRGIGPFLGTLIIAKGDEYRTGLGPPLMLAMSFSAIALSILVPAAAGAAFFDPPKPKEMW